MSLGSICNEITSEAGMQRMMYSEQHDDSHTNSDWVALLTRHVGLAVDDGMPGQSDRFRKQMVRVAALALSAVAAHDRKHPPEKVAGHSIRGSGV